MQGEKHFLKGMKDEWKEGYMERMMDDKVFDLSLKLAKLIRLYKFSDHEIRK